MAEEVLFVLEGWVLAVGKDDLEVLVETDVEVLEEAEEEVVVVVEADTVALDELVVDLADVELLLDEAALTESENIPMLALLSLSPE